MADENDISVGDLVVGLDGDAEGLSTGMEGAFETIDALDERVQRLTNSFREMNAALAFSSGKAMPEPPPASVATVPPPAPSMDYYSSPWARIFEPAPSSSSGTSAPPQQQTPEAPPAFGPQFAFPASGYVEGSTAPLAASTTYRPEIKDGSVVGWKKDESDAMATINHPEASLLTGTTLSEPRPTTELPVENTSYVAQNRPEEPPTVYSHPTNAIFPSPIEPTAPIEEKSTIEPSASLTAPELQPQPISSELPEAIQPVRQVAVSSPEAPGPVEQTVTRRVVDEKIIQEEKPIDLGPGYLDQHTEFLKKQKSLKAERSAGLEETGIANDQPIDQKVKLDIENPEVLDKNPIEIKQKIKLDVESAKQKSAPLSQTPPPAQTPPDALPVAPPAPPRKWIEEPVTQYDRLSNHGIKLDQRIRDMSADEVNSPAFDIAMIEKRKNQQAMEDIVNPPPPEEPEEQNKFRGNQMMTRRIATAIGMASGLGHASNILTTGAMLMGAGMTIPQAAPIVLGLAALEGIGKAREEGIALREHSFAYQEQQHKQAREGEFKAEDLTDTTDAGKEARELYQKRIEESHDAAVESDKLHRENNTLVMGVWKSTKYGFGNPFSNDPTTSQDKEDDLADRKAADAAELAEVARRRVIEQQKVHTQRSEVAHAFSEKKLSMSGVWEGEQKTSDTLVLKQKEEDESLKQKQEDAQTKLKTDSDDAIKSEMNAQREKWIQANPDENPNSFGRDKLDKDGLVAITGLEKKFRVDKTALDKTQEEDKTAQTDVHKLQTADNERQKEQAKFERDNQSAEFKLRADTFGLDREEKSIELKGKQAETKIKNENIGGANAPLTIETISRLNQQEGDTKNQIAVVENDYKRQQSTESFDMQARRDIALHPEKTLEDEYAVALRAKQQTAGGEKKFKPFEDQFRKDFYETNIAEANKPLIEKQRDTQRELDVRAGVIDAHDSRIQAAQQQNPKADSGVIEKSVAVTEAKAVSDKNLQLDDLTDQANLAKGKISEADAELNKFLRENPGENSGLRNVQNQIIGLNQQIRLVHFDQIGKELDVSFDVMTGKLHGVDAEYAKLRAEHKYEDGSKEDQAQHGQAVKTARNTSEEFIKQTHMNDGSNEAKALQLQEFARSLQDAVNAGLETTVQAEADYNRHAHNIGATASLTSGRASTHPGNASVDGRFDPRDLDLPYGPQVDTSHKPFRDPKAPLEEISRGDEVVPTELDSPGDVVAPPVIGDSDFYTDSSDDDDYDTAHTPRPEISKSDKPGWFDFGDDDNTTLTAPGDDVASGREDYDDDSPTLKQIHEDGNKKADAAAAGSSENADKKESDLKPIWEDIRSLLTSIDRKTGANFN